MIVGCFPLSVVPLAVAVVLLAIGMVARQATPIRRVQRVFVYSLAVRAGWLTIAAVGLVALVNDIRALS